MDLPTKDHRHPKARDSIPYSGYFSGGKIFVSSEFLASSWQNFRGRGILNHTPVLCGTVSWVKISWFASQPRKFYPPEKYPLYGTAANHYLLYASKHAPQADLEETERIPARVTGEGRGWEH